MNIANTELPASENALNSSDRTIVQRELWDMTLNTIQDEQLKDVVNDISKAFEDGITGTRTFDQPPLSPETEEKIAELSAEQKYQLTEALTLMSYQQRSASLAAAKNDGQHDGYGEHNSDAQNAVSNIANNKMSPAKVDDIIDALKAPSLEVVFTAHPTYIGELEYTKTLTKMDENLAKGDSEATQESIEKLMDMQTFVATRLKVQDETHIVAHTLTNAWNANPQTHNEFDDAINSTKLVGEYDPIDLKLDISYSSWASSGDKDGNNNINYHTTEDAVTTHRKTALPLIKDDINTIKEGLSEDLQQAFHDDRRSLFKRMDDLSHNPNSTHPDEVKQLLTDLKDFVGDIYEQTKGDETLAQANKSALDLSRNLNTFGLSMGKIEYRETAEESKYVLNHVIAQETIAEITGKEDTQYSALSKEDQINVIDHLLDSTKESAALNALKEHTQDEIDNVSSEKKGRHYNYADSGEGKENEGIFFHTIKRLEIAARNPDMFDVQVLAETESPTQVKEMLLLLRATGNEDNLRVTPLFESPSLLTQIGEITEDLQNDRHTYSANINSSLREYDTKAEKGLKPALPEELKTTIKELPDLLGTDEFKEQTKQITQQLREEDIANALQDIIKTQYQFAHSDNTRRGGKPGASAAIYQAHDDTREALAKTQMGLESYMGGSHTDNYRSGGRSYRAKVNTYEAHDKMKSTVQGMDAIQLFGSTQAASNFVTENIANAAEILERNNRPLSPKEFKGKMMRAVHQEPELLKPIIDQVPRYAEDFFKKEELGYLMQQVFEYSDNKNSGTIASRAAGRKKETADDKIYLDPVGGTRTIGFSETPQHKEVNPSFIGAGGSLRDGVLESTQTQNGDNRSIRKLLLDKEMTESGKNDAEKLHQLYKHNKGFQDIIDHAAFGVAATNADALWEHATKDNQGNQREIKFREKDEAILGKSEIIESRPEKEELANIAKGERSMKQYIARLEIELREAGKLVLEALTGKEVDISKMETNEIRNQTREALPMYKDHFATLDVMAKTTNIIKQTTTEQDRQNTYGKGEDPTNHTTNALNKGLHGANDMATLTRPPFKSEMRNRKLELEKEQEKSQGRGL